jgi:hypothetical protein
MSTINKEGRKHLIKRKDLNFKIGDGWMCEVKKGGKPTGSTLQKDDVVYIAQSGYAIFGKGIVSEIKEIDPIKSLEEFIKYSLHISDVKDDEFWLMKIKEYSKIDNFKDIYILEYKVTNVEQFEVCYPLEKRFLKTPAWYYLEDNFTLPEIKKNTHLTLHIPTKVRDEVYHKFNINAKIHNIDIDHLVPKDIGGVGNLIENLIPISSSINRRKSNHVPSKLFEIGKKFNIKIPSYISSHPSLYLSGPNELKLAKEIVEKLNSQTLDKIKSDYQIIRNFHFPGASSIV